jgi:signal transduction histidine kinase
VLDNRVVFADDGFVGQSAFAPPERARRSEVRASTTSLTATPLVRALLDATDVSVVILNRQRQILAGNSVLLKALDVNTMDSIRGLRPGEVLGCVHAWDRPGGCGTTPDCSACGAVLAILECQKTGGTVERECLMTVRHGDEEQAQELRVRASRLEMESEIYTIVGVRDISAEKRRDALERVFLHDISNTVSPLLNWTRVLTARAQGETADLARRIGTVARRLQREIEDQRALIQAEKGTLMLERKLVEPRAVLEKAAEILRDEWESKGRFVKIVGTAPARAVLTDESLLMRVLVNMIKNAFEATPAGGTVKAWVEELPDGWAFKVWNAGTIAPEIAIQVFKRSFSTKSGGGRGLGTFSMKLFGERYLGGMVGFESAPETGTTFFIRLPLC